jgi:hypothetical protein
MTIDPLIATLEDKLGPEVTGSGGEYDRFGSSVSLDGDRALIGTPGDGDNGALSGSAYLFVRSGIDWSQQAKLSTDLKDLRGQVSIEGDTVLIGGSSEAAYVFVHSGTSWNQQAKLTAADGEHLDYFGGPVSLHDDTALIGAHRDDDQGSDSGAAYVFVRSGTTWNQQAKLTAGDGSAYGYFGSSVSLDGDTALIGADRSESAYVFVRDGMAWSQQAKLTAADGAANGQFGISVGVDGDTALIGADRSESAYVFVRSGTTWSQQSRLTADDGANGD